jgi:putative ABC transport system permease protein
MPLTVENGRHLQLSVMPVTAIHLAPAAMAGPMKAGADLAAVYALIGVGCLIVLAASMNFVNLMTARAARRAVEVGVRRVSGAWHRNLVLQFMGESLIYVMFGMVAALALTAAVLPGFNAFLSRTIGFDYGRDPALMAATAGLVLLIGALAGFYPAVVLARIRPAAVLKGKAQKAGSGIVRQSLVVIQFAILIGLILATGVIYRQTAYALGNGLRLDKDQVLLVHGPCARAFKEEVARLPGVRAVSCARSAPLNFESSSGPALLPTGMETTVAHTSIDFGFFELYGLRPLAGRFFASDRVADVVPADRTGPWQAPLVINEAAMRKFGFATPDAAIGKTVVLTGAGGTRAQTSEIIGVVPDFPVDSIRQPIEETVYYVDPARFGLMSVKLRGEQIPETLRAIDRLWDQVGGRSAPIRREFLDQYQQRLYVDITREADLFAVFAGTAVFIAALGLFGLAVFTAEQRVKEIGIRKALGASRGDVLRLLLWQFAKPVLWANLIAWPVGYAAMQRWLEGFAYHIDPEPSVFIGASAIALAIAIATILGQALHVARAQPVASLRYE